MRQDIKERWLEKLRSGDYRQGTLWLKRLDETGDAVHCCLGVLCEIAVEDGIVAPATEIPYEFNESATILPQRVAEWAGLSLDPMVVINSEGYKLSTLNDDGVNFHEIANHIERCL